MPPLLPEEHVSEHNPLGVGNPYICCSSIPTVLRTSSLTHPTNYHSDSPDLYLGPLAELTEPLQI